MVPVTIRARRGPAAAVAAWLAWSVFLYGNAAHAHRINPAWALNFFWPPIGTFHWTDAAAAQVRLWRAAVVLAAAVTGWLGLGAGLRHWLTRGRRHDLAGAMTALAIGALAAGTLTYALALTGLATPGVLGIALLALLPPGARPAHDAAGAICRAAVRIRPGSAAGIVLLLAAAGILAATLAPETANDALRFHLEVPRRLLLTHRLVPQEESVYAWLPVLTPCRNAVLLLAGGETAVRLATWLHHLLLALLIADLVSRRPGAAPWAPWLAAAWTVLLGVPLLAMTAMPEIELAAVVTLAVEAQARGRSAALTGLLWGAAMALKFQAGLFVVAALAAEGWLRPRRAVSLAGWALMPLLPLAARAWIQGGTPLAPFFMPWWGPGLAHPVVPLAGVRALQALHAPWVDRCTAVYRLATHVAYWDSLGSPLLVALLPVALLVPGDVTARATIAGAVLLWSAAIGDHARYLLPIVPSVLIAAGRAAALWRPRKGGLAAARLVALGVIVFEAAASFHWAYRVLNPVTVAAGLESPVTYLRRSLAPRPLAMEAAARWGPWVRPRTRYLVCGIDNGYAIGGLPYLESEDLPSPWSRWAWASPDAGRLRVALRQRGLDRMIFLETADDVVGEPFPMPGVWNRRSRAVFTTFFRRYALAGPRLTAGGRRISAWAFSARPGPPRPLPAALPGGAVTMRP